jgi:hypothetical protein
MAVATGRGCGGWGTLATSTSWSEMSRELSSTALSTQSVGCSQGHKRASRSGRHNGGIHARAGSGNVLYRRGDGGHVADIGVRGGGAGGLSEQGEGERQRYARLPSTCPSTPRITTKGTSPNASAGTFGGAGRRRPEERWRQRERDSTLRKLPFANANAPALPVSVSGCIEQRVGKAATSKADPRQQQDWILKGLQGGRALPPAARGVATLCFRARG